MMPVAVERSDPVNRTGGLMFEARFPDRIDGLRVRRMIQRCSEDGTFDGHIGTGRLTLGMLVSVARVHMKVDGKEVVDGHQPLGSFCIPPSARISGINRGHLDFIELSVGEEIIEEFGICGDINRVYDSFPAGFAHATPAQLFVTKNFMHAIELVESVDYILIDQMLDCLTRIALTNHSAIRHRRTRERLSPYVQRRVLNYIDDRLSTALSLSELADVAGVSRSHFARAFRESVGASPHSYIVGRRITRALELLRSSHEPISWIAARTGFADHAHLTRSIRASCGGSNPSELR